MIAYQGTISFTSVDVMIRTERQHKKKSYFCIGAREIGLHTESIWNLSHVFKDVWPYNDR